MTPLSTPIHRAVDQLPQRYRRHVLNALQVASNSRGERRFITRDYLYKLIARATPSFEIESGDARFVLNTADREVSRILFVHGHYDRPLMKSVHDLLGQLDGRPFSLAGSGFLDLGANLGSATVEALVHFGAAAGVAFEPEPVNFSFLQRNLAANGLLARVAAHRLALSDEPGELDFELSPTNAGDHRVRTADPTASDLGEGTGDVIRVPAVTLDSLCEDGTVDLSSIALAWIDVQGHEPHLLAGATRLTSSGIPTVMEYWPYGLRRHDTLGPLDALLSEHYTHVLDIDHAAGDAERGLLPVSDLAELHDRYTGPRDQTDLLLLRR